jgi:YVTN family beta-propeller protein
MRLFRMNFGQARVRLVQVGAVLAAAVLVAGCGNNYRPTVTPINSNGPASQPSSYAVVVSAPASATPGVELPGIATIIDYSGDAIMATAAIGPGPTTFTLDENGDNGYTINSDGTLTQFPVSSSLQEKQVLYATLPSTAQPLNLFSPTLGLWAADLNGNFADYMVGSPATFNRQIPLAATPVMVVGPGLSGLRFFAVSQGSVSSGVACNTSPITGPFGEVTGIETISYSTAPPIPVGKCPVYAIESTDTKRVFVLNRGGDATNPGGSISVINAQNDTLDTCTPFQNQDGHWVTCHPSIALPAGPVYAEYNAATQQLVVANYDSSTISIIDVSLDEYGNDYNTYANNNCATYAACGAITGGFGTTYTVAVGANPASVTVLNDGSRAYTANQADQTVSIVNLSSHTVEATLPITGHPRSVVSTQNSTQGKVYVASPDSNVLTIIRTDLDIVDTTLLMQGNIVDVRVTTQTGNGGNSNDVSRIPGYGQPCNLPGTAATASLAACKALP